MVSYGINRWDTSSCSAAGRILCNCPRNRSRQHCRLKFFFPVMSLPGHLRPEARQRDGPARSCLPVRDCRFRPLRDCGDFCGDFEFTCTKRGATQINSIRLANPLTHKALQDFLPSNQQVANYLKIRFLNRRARVRIPSGPLFNKLQGASNHSTNGAPNRGSGVRISPGLPLSHLVSATWGSLNSACLELGCIRGAHFLVTSSCLALACGTPGRILAAHCFECAHCRELRRISFGR
jgi:hypothetical protein